MKLSIGELEDISIALAGHIIMAVRAKPAEKRSLYEHDEILRMANLQARISTRILNLRTARELTGVES